MAWLKTTGSPHLTTLENGSSRSRCPQGSMRMPLSRPLPQLLVVAGHSWVPWLVDVSPLKCLHMASSVVCLCANFSSLQGHRHNWVRPTLLQELGGWPKSRFWFFHKIKDTFFIFTNNFIDLDILSMSAVSRVV